MTHFQTTAETAQDLIRCLRRRPGIPTAYRDRLTAAILHADREGARFWCLFDGPGFRSLRVLHLSWHGGSEPGITWLPT